MPWICTFILLLLLEGFAFGKRYSLSDNWIVKSEDLNMLEAANGTGSFGLIHSRTGLEIVSRNGTFALAFFRFKNQTTTYLSIVMGSAFRRNSSTAAVVVWTANRDAPIYGNATIKLGALNSIVLVDSRDNIFWESPRNVSGVEVQESGEFSVFNSSGASIWRSLDHVTDVILEGQKIYQGQELASSLSSLTLASGNYRLKVDVTGIVFNVVYPDRVLEPYFEWNIWNQGNNNRNITCPTYQTVLTFNVSAINMFYEKIKDSSPGNFAKCGPDLSAPLSGRAGSLKYLKLDSTGQALVFSLDPQTLVWEQSAISLVSSRIGACLPLTCGAHSICQANGQCQCLNIQSQKIQNGCSAPQADKPLPCNKLESKNHHFRNFSGTSYFANHYTKADRTSTLNDCWNICLSNCSCRAFFYTSGGSCYFMSTLRGSWTSDTSSIAFLKLQNPELIFPKTHRDTIIISSGVGGGTLLILACIGLVAVHMWRKQARKIAGVLAAALQHSIHQYSYKELKLATTGFSSRIGSGGSGLVYQGTLSDGTRVAVKKLHDSSQREFIAEVNTIGSVSHTNIVKLCGFCAEGFHRLLVYEFVVNGSLDKWLFDDSHDDLDRESDTSRLDWKTRYNIALGVARGLSYLHEESKQLIMHLDIKPENILLDADFSPKLSDFGVSKLSDRDCSQGTTFVRGTPGYLAPEWLLDSVATRKCDVYSYGMVLLELVGGRRNFKPKPSLNKVNDVDDDETLAFYFPAWVVRKLNCPGKQESVQGILDASISEEAPVSDAKRLIFVALWCIQESPAQRPSMDSVVKMLEGNKEVMEPPMEFHFAIPSPGLISISTTG